MITKIYIILDEIYFTRILMDILSYVRRIFIITKVKPEQLTNLEGIKDMNIPMSWFSEKKPLGISGVARLKNGDDFLEEVIESHIPFLDEIILVDNMSTDNTKNLCLKLKKKYPKKIKFFEYKYKVYPPGVDKKIESNSIHSLAYYYNWCFSKSRYSHVMKVDDDNLLLPDKWQEIRKKSLKSNNYNVFWGYNILNDKNGNIVVPKKHKYSGRYGDIGIYRVSPKTYYIQSKNYEKMNNNLFYIRNGFAYFHLKFLKKGKGFYNLTNSQYARNFKNKIESSSTISILKLVKKDSLNFLYRKLDLNIK